jgi:hypothetical protein
LRSFSTILSERRLPTFHRGRIIIICFDRLLSRLVFTTQGALSSWWDFVINHGTSFQVGILSDVLLCVALLKNALRVRSVRLELIKNSLNFFLFFVMFPGSSVSLATLKYFIGFVYHVSAFLRSFLNLEWYEILNLHGIPLVVYLLFCGYFLFFI